MKILITGANGQLGTNPAAKAETLNPNIEIRNKFEARNPKSQSTGCAESHGSFSLPLRERRK
jgi:hypothetical protein